MRKKIFISLMMILFIILLETTFSRAAIVAASQEVESGGDVAIVVKSDTPISSYTVTATSYNGLTFTTSSGGTGAGTTTISDAKATGTMTTLATFRFKAPTVTENTTYTVSFKATGMGDVDLTPIADSECSVTVKVKAPQNTNPVQPTTPTTPNTPTENNNTPATKSSEARLKDLGIKPKDYDFSGFSKDINKEIWDAKEVPNNVTEVTVYATAKDNKAKVTGTGKVKLEEGLNKLNVVVTAEDGTKKTYTINITRAKATTNGNSTAEPTKPTNNETEKPITNEKENNNQPEKTDEKESKKPVLKSLEIEELDLLPVFNSEIYEYKTTLKENLTELNVIAKCSDEKVKVEISGNTNIKNGENVITILLQDKENDEITTYQVVVNKQFSEQLAAPKGFFSNWNPKDRTMFLIFSGMAFVIIIAIILLLVIKRREDEEIQIMGLLPGGEKLQEAINEHFEVIKNNELNQCEKQENFEENNENVNFEDPNTSYYIETSKEQRERTSQEISAIQELFNNSNEEEFKPRKGRGKHF